MGQVNVDLEDLVAAGCTVRHAKQVIEGDTPVVLNYAVVVFWDGCEIGSNSDDCLNFDCSSRDSHNLWALYRLMGLGVPFTWA